LATVDLPAPINPDKKMRMGVAYAARSRS
jgi:hypothetical protein